VVDAQAGIIGGEGSDNKGKFTLRGFIGKSYKVTFIKKYDASSKLVHFRGLVNAEQTFISGSYGYDPTEKFGRFNLRNAYHDDRSDRDVLDEQIWDRENELAVLEY
jgi:hypothetical protein